MVSTEEDFVSEYQTASNNLAKQTRQATILVSIIATVLAVLFSYLKFSDLNLKPLATSDMSWIIHKFALAIYYLSWTAGTPFDAFYQSQVYYGSDKSNLPKFVYGCGVGLALFFAALCFFSDPERFPFVLGAFWLFNLISWRVGIAGLIGKLIDNSYSFYQSINDIPSILKVYIVDKYIRKAKWQWYRFVFGFTFIVFIFIYDYYGMEYVHLITAVPADFIRESIILLFVISVESWIWFMRFRYKFNLILVDEIKKSLTFQPKNGRLQRVQV